MALEPGQRVGAYEILGALGAGGMGEIYRARDAALNRDVALKVLPELFARDPDRLARFKREAQVLAALNHPHIAHIYGLDTSEQDGGAVSFIVMELVEGADLAQRIAGGPMPIDEALPIARQIAEALEAAHEQGIVHRDLKPANIKVRDDGTVKVLDFGLAKALEPVGGPIANQTMSPTITSPAMTQLGMILGTAAYMSPEQAKGRAADRRSDIWSFGCVLYEMLAGRRPFDGEDVSDTLAAVLRGEPDWTALPRDVPVQVLMLLRRCLQRDPQKRLPHIGVARLDIEDAIAAPSSTPLPARARRNAVWIRVLPYVAAAAMASVITALVQRGADDGSRPPPPVRRLTILSPAAAAFMPASAGALPNVAISRDGTRIVYVGQAPNGARALYLRALDRLDPIPLPGTANAVDAFFSPDGGSVAFFIDTRGGFANGVLKRVALTGGGTDTVASIDGVTSGGAWGADGTIVFSMASAGGPGIPQSIFVAPAAGGAARPIVKLTGTSERSYGFPEVLPDGQHMLVSVRTGRTYAEAHVEAMTTDGTPVRTVLENGFHARFASGHLLYRLGSNLMAVGFDPARLQTTGAPVTLAENFGAPTPRGDALFDVSQNGVLCYAASSASTEMPRRLLTWVDRTGHEEPVPTPERAYTYPRISPDGGRVALDIRDQDSDIWTLDLTRNVLSRVTLDPAQDFYPTWSPDGKRLAYSSSRSGTFNLYWQSADGSGQAERLTQSSTTQATYAITPDGTRLLFRDGVPRTGEDLMLVSLAGDATASGTRHRVTPLLQTPFNERNGEVSPDGRWLAYESDESGRDEIYVRPFPNVDGGRWPISADGGTRPVWARNGRELFYITGATPNPVRVVRVSVETTQGFVPGPPQVLFEGRYYVDPRVAARGRTYDVSPDGQRFLMIKDVESIEKAPTAPLPLVVVLNWQEELKQRAAAR